MKIKLRSTTTYLLTRWNKYSTFKGAADLFSRQNSRCTVVRSVWHADVRLKEI